MTTDTIAATYFETPREYDEAMSSLLARIENPATGEAAIPTGLEESVQQFLDRARATGALLDGTNERRRYQSDVDYLARLLEEKTSRAERYTLEPFDRDALATVEPPSYPFDELRTMDASPAPDAREIEALLNERAGRTGVRFDEGLVQDLAREVQGEPQGYPLLEFGLRELYEHHRVGNKLFRPSPGTAFSCKQVFAERLKAFYAERDEAEQAALEPVLVALTRRDWSLRRRFQPVLDELKSARLAYESTVPPVASADARPVRLVYEGAVGYWPQLAEWVMLARRKRQHKRLLSTLLFVGVAVLGAALFVGSLIVSARQDKADDLAIRTFEGHDAKRLEHALDAAALWPTVMSRHAVFTAFNLHLNQEPPTTPSAPAVRVDRVGDRFLLRSGDKTVELKGLPGGGAPCVPGQFAVCDFKLSPTAVVTLVRHKGAIKDTFAITILDVSTGDVARSIDDTRCGETLFPGDLKMSSDGKLVSYTCHDSPRYSVWSVSNDPAATAAAARIERVGARSYDVFFAKSRPDFIVISEPGVVTVAALYGAENRRTFIIPTPGTVPKAVDFSRRSWHFAVLDSQDVLTIYESRLQRWLRWFRPKQYEVLSVVFQTSVRGGEQEGPARGIEFTADERCVRVERAGGPADDFFIDDRSLLEEARKALGGRRDLSACGPVSRPSR
jgi:hypothetical protein